MAETTQSNLRYYLKEVKRRLICDKKRKRAYLSMISDGITEYLNDNPSTDYNRLIEYFGTPDCVAYSCNFNMLFSQTNHVK